MSESAKTIAATLVEQLVNPIRQTIEGWVITAEVASGEVADLKGRINQVETTCAMSIEKLLESHKVLVQLVEAAKEDKDRIRALEHTVAQHLAYSQEVKAQLGALVNLKDMKTFLEKDPAKLTQDERQMLPGVKAQYEAEKETRWNAARVVSEKAMPQ